MWSNCMMTWKTFLALFKKDYKFFTFYDGYWHFKQAFSDIKIFLKLNDSIIKNGDIVFVNYSENIIKPIKWEELQWNLIEKNIILY